MAALNDKHAAVLKLLAGPSDEHILAALTVLPRLDPPPAPSACADALNDQGFRFLSRLVSTGLKDLETKSAYISTALQCYSYLLSTPESSSAIPPRLLAAAPDTFTNLSTILSTTSLPRSTITLALSVLCHSGSPQSISFDLIKSLLVLSADDDATKLCVQAANSLALTLAPTLSFKDATCFLVLSTSLPISLQFFAELLSKSTSTKDSPSPPSFLASFASSPPLQKVARRLLTSALNNSDDPGTKNLGLTIINTLLSHSASWAVDASNDSQALKVFVRVSCGELRIVLAAFLGVLERDDITTAKETFPEVPTLVSIFLSTTKYLLEVMDDDEEAASAAPFAALPFDSLIHIKGSLDDAVDSMTQLMGDEAVTKLSSRDAPAHLLETLTSLLQPLGCWFAENDVDDSIYVRNNLKKCMENGLLICGGDFANLLPLMPALSKIMHTDSAAGDDIGETLMLNSRVFKRLLKFLKQCTEGEFSMVEGVVWATDVLEGGAKWLNKEGRSEAARETAALMEKGEGVAGMYLVRAFFGVCGRSKDVGLSDEVVKRARGGCEAVFSPRFLAEIEGGEHDGNFVDLCYKLESGEGKVELFELVCKSSTQFSEMLGLLQRQALLS